MTEHSNENRGAIWKNEKKESDKHPDFTGSLNVGGVEYWVSAWKRKEGAAAKAPALSFSIKPKDEQQPQAASRSGLTSRAPARNADMDDEIPF